MGRFFREFDDKPRSAAPSFTVMLLGTVMFGAMIWLIQWSLKGTVMSLTELLPR